MLFQNPLLQKFYNRLLAKGADRLILDQTMALDIHGNYAQCCYFNPTEGSRYLRRKYRGIIQSIKERNFVVILNTKVYH